MKSIPACGLLSAALLFATACDSLDTSSQSKSVDPKVLQGAADAAGAQAAAPVDLGRLLAGIQDGPTAEAAKGPLTAALPQLQSALAGAKAGGEAAGAGSAEAGAGANKMVQDVLAKFGLGAGTVDTITGLLGNPAVKSAIGPLLDQLKGLLPSM